jgi:alkylation response protein AidB-like acyl-CoA dehydrogenase
MEWERALILAGQLGVMQRQLEQVVEYAQTRRQFQQPIGKFQAVSHPIADMALRIEIGRLLLYKAAALKEAGRSAGTVAAMAKLWISESAVQSALQALQIRAGYGYVENPSAASSLQDAIGSRILSGTSEMMRNLIAHELGL